MLCIFLQVLSETSVTGAGAASTQAHAAVCRWRTLCILQNEQVKWRDLALPRQGAISRKQKEQCIVKTATAPDQFCSIFSLFHSDKPTGDVSQGDKLLAWTWYHYLLPWGVSSHLRWTSAVPKRLLGPEKAVIVILIGTTSPGADLDLRQRDPSQVSLSLALSLHQVELQWKNCIPTNSQTSCKTLPLSAVSNDAGYLFTLLWPSGPVICEAQVMSLMISSQRGVCLLMAQQILICLPQE